MGAVKSHCPKTRRATGCFFYIASLTLLGISVPIFFESWPHLQIATVLKLCGRCCSTSMRIGNMIGNKYKTYRAPLCNL